jgi:hypothetical protein
MFIIATSLHMLGIKKAISIVSSEQPIHLITGLFNIHIAFRSQSKLK